MYHGRSCLYRCPSVNEGGGLPLASGSRSLLGGVPLASGPRSSLGGTPARIGVPFPLARIKDRYHPPPPSQESECCYTAGGKPLAVTQEDFLVNDSVQVYAINFDVFIWLWLFVPFFPTLFCLNKATFLTTQQ